MEHEPRLPVHEKIAVLLICILFGIFVLLSQWRKDPLFFEIGEKTQTVSDEVEVQVYGEEENPGSFRVKKGEPLKNVIASAKPTANADLKKLDQESLIVRRRTVTVRKTQMITITIIRENQRHLLEVPKGTRRGDLPELKLKYPNRKLKDGDTFEADSISQQPEMRQWSATSGQTILNTP